MLQSSKGSISSFITLESTYNPQNFKSIDCSRLIKTPLRSTLQLDLNTAEPLTKESYAALIEKKFNANLIYTLALIAVKTKAGLELYPCDATHLQERIKQPDLCQVLGIQKMKSIFYFYIKSSQDEQFTPCYAVDELTARRPSLKLFLAENNSDTAQGMYKLAKRYEKGRNNDLQKAIKFYTSAADQDYAPAQIRLANHYLAGTGLETNSMKAIELYKKAILQGSSEAQHALASYYMNNKDETTNISEALRLFELLVQKKWVAAYYPLATLYFSDANIQQNKNRAIALFKEGAQLNCLRSQMHLGSLYLSGEHVAKDFGKAQYFYSLAAKQGSNEARELLSELGETKEILGHRFSFFK